MKLGYLLAIAIFGGLTFVPAAQACEGVTCALPPPPPVVNCGEDNVCTVEAPDGPIWGPTEPIFDLLDLVLNDPLSNAIYDAIMRAYCEGETNNIGVEPAPNGAVVHLPNGRYYGWANPCPEDA